MFRNLWKAIEAVIQRSQESQAKTCNEVVFLVKLEARTKCKTLLQMFSSEFLKVFQNSYSTEHLWNSYSAEHLWKTYRISRPVMLCKKMLLKILYKKTQENTCAGISNFIKKELWHRCFLVMFEKILKTVLFEEDIGRLLLDLRTTSARYSSSYFL